MATVIPVEGELQSIASPKNREELTRLFESLLPSIDFREIGIDAWMSPTVEAFFFCVQYDLPYNQRATQFIAKRNGNIVVLGPVLYISSDEWFLFRNPADPSNSRELPETDPFVDWLENSPFPFKKVEDPYKDYVSLDHPIFRNHHHLLRTRFGAFFEPTKKQWLLKAHLYEAVFAYFQDMELRGVTERGGG